MRNHQQAKINQTMKPSQNKGTPNRFLLGLRYAWAGHITSFHHFEVQWKYIHVCFVLVRWGHEGVCGHKTKTHVNPTK